MIRVVSICLVVSGFIMACPAYAQDGAPPPPERNPLRLGQSAPEQKPNLPGDQPTVAWTDPKVDAAVAACGKLLKDVALDYEQLPPIKHGLCGAPAPIRVKSIGKDPAVVIEPPATITCPLAASLAAWLKDKVQPAAATLGSAVVKIHNASSYKCRNRYGGANTKLSEHALANALDISEFVFASGQHVTVLKSWPRFASAALPVPPSPPLPNPHRLASPSADQDEAPSEATGAIVPVSAKGAIRTTLAVARTRTNPFVRPTGPPPPQSPLPSPSSHPFSERVAAIAVAKAKQNPFVSPLPDAGIDHPSPETKQAPEEKADAKPEPAEAQPPRKLEPEQEAAFVRAIHADACKVFETVLGPRANAAHKDHFHLDMKKRRYVKICE